jgi:ferredoxin
MSGQTFQVRIGNNGAIISCAAEQTILRASLAAGLDYPYGCASGNCGVCISQLESGQVSMCREATLR